MSTIAAVVGSLIGLLGLLFGGSAWLKSRKLAAVTENRAEDSEATAEAEGADALESKKAAEASLKAEADRARSGGLAGELRRAGAGRPKDNP